jgi:signal transduction histidine kinase
MSGHAPKPLGVNSNTPVRRLQIERIRLGSQPQENLIEERVIAYRDRMRCRVKVDPVLVYYDGEDYFLKDGFQRVEAALRLGRKTILAKIKGRNMSTNWPCAKLEVEEFVYTVAHDLRDPLSAICEFTEVLAQRMDRDEASKELAALIMNAANLMSTLIDDLLSFANASAIKPRQRVELRHAVAQATQNLARAIKASGAMMTVDQLPIVRSDESQLVRVFQNLIGNAIKYHAERSPEIHITAEQRGPDWVIRIEDHGQGIAPEDQARVFTPFIRLANQNVPGTGLGLAVCRKIVEGMGGIIWVESELGAGSTFCFTIPAAQEGILVP